MTQTSSITETLGPGPVPPSLAAGMPHTEPQPQGAVLGCEAWSTSWDHLGPRPGEALCQDRAEILPSPMVLAGRVSLVQKPWQGQMHLDCSVLAMGTAAKASGEDFL